VRDVETALRLFLKKKGISSAVRFEPPLIPRNYKSGVTLQA
jgi:hypothetical protein